MPEEAFPDFKFRGARALCFLQEINLWDFLEIWSDAKEADLELPKIDDPDYASLDTLLRHVLRASRGYIIWICEQLGLPDPEIRKVPEADKIDDEVEEYAEHLLEQWRQPLIDIEEKRFYQPTYTSRWKVDYSIEAMLEHAVAHPMRHTFQLVEWLDELESDDEADEQSAH